MEAHCSQFQYPCVSVPSWVKVLPLSQKAIHRGLESPASWLWSLVLLWIWALDFHTCHSLRMLCLEIALVCNVWSDPRKVNTSLHGGETICFSEKMGIWMARKGFRKKSPWLHLGISTFRMVKEQMSVVWTTPPPPPQVLVLCHGSRVGEFAWSVLEIQGGTYHSMPTTSLWPQECTSRESNIWRLASSLDQWTYFHQSWYSIKCGLGWLTRRHYDADFHNYWSDFWGHFYYVWLSALIITKISYVYFTGIAMAPLPGRPVPPWHISIHSESCGIFFLILFPCLTHPHSLLILPYIRTRASSYISNLLPKTS